MTSKPPKPSAKKAKPKAPAASRKPQKSADDARPRKKAASPTSPAVNGAKGRVVARPPSRPAFVPRAVANIDDDDVLMAHGGGGTGFGRCGGRLLSSKLEQDLCNRLGMAGVVHSHSPRHYEIRYEEGKVAAYAPMIVLRGRGREGKGVVIEAVEESKAPILRKITSFRSQYGQEFYVILVGSDEALDEAPLSAYDEACSSTNVNTLIARLAE
ncbi:MAG: hypothetical protein MUC36_08225 [Planctomycetes bacterium]|jgi:hypothetical protein|nr:hypothetical protein [Planctomycetota bacterium]